MMYRGLVSEIDGATAMVQVELPDLDINTDWIPVGQSLTLGGRGYVLPRKGSQVVILCGQAGLDDAVVLCGIYSKADPAPVSDPQLVCLELEDGTKISLDPNTSTVVVDTPGTLIAKTKRDLVAEVGGDLRATAGGKATLESGSQVVLKAPQIRLDGAVESTMTLTVAGSVFANGGITTSSGAAIPGGLEVVGPLKGASIVINGSATFAGKPFASHTHAGVAPGSGASGPVV